MLVLALLFLVIPLVELYVIIQVGQSIGALNTVGLLLLDSLIGAWLMKREGLAVLRRLQSQLEQGNVPGKELVDAFLILFGGALMLAPGFITDLVGMSLLVPPVRAVVRVLARRFKTMAVHRAGPGPSGAWSGEHRERDRPSVTEVLVPRDVATVMLVRDGDDGVEVFMLRRHLDSAFLGGHYVFPGGAVDDHDRHADLDAVCVGRSDASASAQLDLEPPEGGLAFWVAGIREAFEEAGVLLAYGADGRIIDWSDPDVAARFAEHRKAVDTGELRLVDICVEEGLQLAVDSVHYFSHWITPVGPPRRFDTRFFVARAPDSHTYLHDERETIDNTWVRPVDAIAMAERGEIDIIFPTQRTLESMGRFDTTDELLRAAAAIENVPVMLPRAVKDGDGVRILLPGDDGYDDAVTSP